MSRDTAVARATSNTQLKWWQSTIQTAVGWRASWPGSTSGARSAAHAETLAAGIPDARLHLLETGHSPMYEAAEELAKIVAEMETAAAARP